MHPRRISPRDEYRQQENLRIQDSVSLEEKFQDLKSLTVDLAHFVAERLTKTSEIKYTVNLAHAKSVFRFQCSNQECVGGDFDLSAKLAKAIAARDATVTGEVICQGWRNKATIDQVHCHNILRFRLSLGY
jgi:hypothetical protein